MKKLICFLLLNGILHVVFAQNAAHSTYISYAIADGRGEVVATVDNNDSVKFWSIKDGKLLFTTKIGQPEWYSKRTRYKMKNNDFEDSYDVQSEDGKNDTEYLIMTRTPWSVVGRATFKKDAVASYRESRVADKVLFFGVQDKKANLWMCTLNNKDEPQKFANFKTEERYIYPEWSPKAQWIMCVQSKRIWNAATGRESKFDDSVETRGRLNNHAYNVPEDKVGIPSKEGMAIIETSTGKLLNIYPIPMEISPSKDYIIPKRSASGNPVITPLSDGKSFLYYYEVWSNDSDKNNIKYRRAWIVTEGKVVAELVD